MRVAIWPFCSQQCKLTGRFLLDADVTVAISEFIAEKLMELGVKVRMLLPEHRDGPYETRIVPFPLSNRERRESFNADAMKAALEGCDTVVSHHELASTNLRRVTSARIVQFNHLMPLGEWSWMREQQKASWAAADLAVFMSEDLRSFACAPRSAVWPMVYDKRYIQHGLVRDVDVLFVQRCSASNYTHHKEFLEATELLHNLRAVFTDPTRYLESVGGYGKCVLAHCERREDYYRLLARSTIVVALMRDDLHGGVAVREAMASGCSPVLLDAPCYRQFTGARFTSSEPSAIAEALRAALVEPLPVLCDESYQNAWPTVEANLLQS